MILPSIALLAALAADPTPVVLSSDCGCEMDDQWALTLLALSPAIDLRAVVTAHAPGLTSDASAQVARDVLDRLPLAKKPPVVPGSSRPLVDRKTPRPGPGVDRLLAESRGFGPEKRLTLVMIGPATDVASALLTDPTLADRVAVVAMAFDDWERGNDPFNVRNDVAAWQVLMASRATLTVADGTVTIKHLTITRDRARSKLAGTGPAGDFLVSILDKWLDRSGPLARRITGSADAWPVWDCGAVSVLLGLATVESRPRPALRDDRTFDHGHPTGTIGWVTSIEGDRLWSELAARLRAPR